MEGRVEKEWTVIQDERLLENIYKKGMLCCQPSYSGGYKCMIIRDGKNF
jgi:hypothetical protein